MKLAILFLMTVFTLSSSAADSVNVKLATSKTNELIHKIKNMLSLYRHDCKTFPKSLAGLKENLENCKNWGPVAYTPTSWDFKDGWSNDLKYIPAGNGYMLISLGADGKEGGTGSNMDIQSQEK